MELLKRSYKSKLRKGYTHPLGLKIISDCLFPCKHYSDLELVFDDDTDNRLGVYVPGWFDGRKLKGYSKELLSFQCFISINYSEQKDEWVMNLYPVELDKTRRSKSILLRIALPEIKNWLNGIHADPELKTEVEAETDTEIDSEVETEIEPQIRIQNETEGKPEIKKEIEDWYKGNRHLQIGIDYKTKKYCIFETQDDRIIDKRIENIYAK